MNAISIAVYSILLTSRMIHTKIITVDTSNGNNSIECCAEGDCLCTSLSIALLYMDDNTTVNIVSPSITLNTTIIIGLNHTGSLNKISIIGNDTVITCDNYGSLCCESCSNVRIIAITWNKCGNLNGADTAGITFKYASNLTFINNAFHYSQLQGVTLLEVSGSIIIKHCNFLATEKSMANYSNGLSIKRHYEKLPNDLSLHISESSFSNNNSVYSVNSDNPGAVSIVSSYGNVEIYLTNVTFVSNGNGAVYVELNSFNVSDKLCLYTQGCKFVDNKSCGHGAAFYINTGISKSPRILIDGSEFVNNNAGDSIISVFAESSSATIEISNTSFINNVASCMYIPGCKLTLSSRVLFENNTSDNGAALYLNRGASVDIIDKADVQFSNNVVLQNGGAIYVDLIFHCEIKIFLIPISTNYKTQFINNSAGIAGNALFFSVPKACEVDTNINNVNSFMYIPCKFNYYQPVNNTVLDIPCNFDYTKLNGTGSPIVTTPHQLKLYFPYSVGFMISPDAYFIKNNILGLQVLFTGAVFDYFGMPTEPTQFNVKCLECSTQTLLKDYHLLIDNATNLGITFKGNEINTDSKNVTVQLKSLFYSLQEISIILKVELLPCISYPGKAYSEEKKMCICYKHNVNCYDDYNEIRRGYWFGSVLNKATTSLCPNHYCRFVDRKETTSGYFELPKAINAQCNHHRMGIACGRCASGYTLTYDSPDCINTKHCNAGMRILVVVLTCLYWVAVVVGVFSLMYFNFQISSGYVYGLIYYYSIVDVLLNNNPYISDGAFQFVSVLSSFAQLSPQFLGKLCFVENLSGIDQLFIHYTHPVVISVLLLFIILAARCSARITLFISRCIIRVICLLLLLSYTSLASTSLQLLRPLRFTDIKEAHTYSSPHIRYFYGRHAFYGTVAIICEFIIVLGLPLFLLLEPLLSRKINFIKLKPILDQFRGCYKDKYRWFAAYYLIGRLVIFLIVYVLNNDYYTMLFYLQTACIIIAMIHIWAQPYKNELLNSLDGVTLLVMVLIVSVNVFSFLQNLTTTLSIFLVVFPLFLYSLIGIKNIITSRLKTKSYYRVINAESVERVDEDDIRYVANG